MCLTPVTIKREIAGRYYLNNVPCNTCLECVKDRQNAYIVRTIEEQKKRGSMVFFTLTYSPEALPINEYEIEDPETGGMLSGEAQTLRRADVTAWLNAFRKRWKRKGVKLDFGHMITGEYSPVKMRPHYHGIILGLEREKVNELMYDWKKKFGFVCFNFIPSLAADVEKVARYTAKYTIKDESWNVVPEGAEKPRIMTSQFYGMPSPERWKSLKNYWLAKDIVDYDIDKPVFENVAQQQKVVRAIISRRKYRLSDGREFKLPAYYKRKVFYSLVTGKVRASAIQRMVSYNVQRDFDKLFKEELHNLATLYDIREYSKVVDKYNAIHEDDKFYRAYRYAENNTKYMVKSKL